MMLLGLQSFIFSLWGAGAKRTILAHLGPSLLLYLVFSPLFRFVCFSITLLGWSFSAVWVKGWLCQDSCLESLVFFSCFSSPTLQCIPSFHVICPGWCQKCTVWAEIDGLGTLEVCGLCQTSRFHAGSRGPCVVQVKWLLHVPSWKMTVVPVGDLGACVFLAGLMVWAKVVPVK